VGQKPVYPNYHHQSPKKAMIVIGIARGYTSNKRPHRVWMIQPSASADPNSQLNVFLIFAVAQAYLVLVM
jgi:hypothetical protein